MENKNVATFVKIVEFNNFTRAAESLGYSQAAVTAQIKAMEKELGVPLFDRIGKRISLTQAGKTFLPYALNMLKAEEEAINSVRPQEVLTGELRICSATSYASSVLPDILLRYAQRHPQVRLVVKVSDYTEDTTLKVARGEIDFLIMLEEQNARPEFRTVTSIYQPLVFLTYPNNPILENGSLSLAEIVENQFIVADREIGYSALLERQLRQEGIPFHPVMEMGSVDAILQVLLGGHGITFVPAFAASTYLESGQLVSIDCEKISFDMYANYICSKDRWMSPVMKEFVKVVEEYA